MKKTVVIGFFILMFVKNASAFTVNHEFDVFIGKFNASRTNFSYTLSDKTYAVNSDVKTYGLFDTLYPFQAIYSTNGRIVKKDILQTLSYKYSAQSRFTLRKKELIYNDDGIPTYRISSKNDKEKRANIDMNIDIKGTTDLQTVIAELILQYNKLRFCAAEMQVFDGKQRFNVIFRDEGQDILKANEYSKFEGKAVKCSMYIDNLGAKNDDLLWEITSDRPVNFWIMEEGDKKIPFIARIEVKETQYGKLKVYTKSVTITE